MVCPLLKPVGAPTILLILPIRIFQTFTFTCANHFDGRSFSLHRSAGRKRALCTAGGSRMNFNVLRSFNDEVFNTSSI